MRNGLHGAQHVGVHDGIKVLLRGRGKRVGAADDASHIDRQVELFTVELPGQAAHAGGVGHVHGEHVSAQGLHALAPRVVAHGGDDAAAVFGVLAHQLQPNAARCTDDEDGLHGKYFNQIGL